jgi:putative DNA primase/helicase
MSDAADRKKARLARAEKVLKWALESESARRINAMLDLARSEPGIPVRPCALDRDPWLFNCTNGTLELRTGRLREHWREDNLTRLCPTEYHPAAPCPHWLHFLDAVFERDPGVVQFVQRLLGRGLTGDVSEQILPIFWGAGANGKSTLVNAVMRTLGPDYCMKAPAELLLERRGEHHPTELAQLFGMRLVVASETHQGRRLNEALIKDLTGGERIRARRMREDFWEFDPTHKIILLTNHKPVITGNDEGIWRRLRLVPFEVTFWNPDEPGDGRPPELRQDKELPGKLDAERQGILAWMVAGCLDWQREGLPLPKKVRAATAEYRGQEDQLAQFLVECCVRGSNDYRVRAHTLYTRYRKWAEDGKEYPYSQRRFGEAMAKRFRKEVSNGTWYVGVALARG